jgi:hypothetical protein
MIGKSVLLTYVRILLELIYHSLKPVEVIG